MNTSAVKQLHACTPQLLNSFMHTAAVKQLHACICIHAPAHRKLQYDMLTYLYQLDVSAYLHMRRHVFSAAPRHIEA